MSLSTACILIPLHAMPSFTLYIVVWKFFKEWHFKNIFIVYYEQVSKDKHLCVSYIKYKLNAFYLSIVTQNIINEIDWKWNSLEFTW